METDFDPEDKYSWYFGMLSREKTNDILMEQDYDGTFLVRDSKSCQGDFVLCVREDQKVSHYIVNRVQTSEGITKFRIGDKEFSDMPSLLTFYKTHYLDTTTLMKPVTRIKLKCKYTFDGKDPEDLPFEKGDILDLIYKDEEEWWTAINTNFRSGQIPALYTEVLRGDELQSPIIDRTPQGRRLPQLATDGGIYSESRNSVPAPGHGPDTIQGHPAPQSTELPNSYKSIRLPAKAIVMRQRIPNAYAHNQLKLEVGEIITVLKMNPDGQWEGRDMKDNQGLFPFTYIRFLTEEELRQISGSI